jgi:hypothetical protein
MMKWILLFVIYDLFLLVENMKISPGYLYRCRILIFFRKNKRKGFKRQPLRDVFNEMFSVGRYHYDWIYY